MWSLRATSRHTKWTPQWTPADTQARAFILTTTSPTFILTTTPPPLFSPTLHFITTIFTTTLTSPTFTTTHSPHYHTLSPQPAPQRTLFPTHTTTPQHTLSFTTTPQHALFHKTKQQLSLTQPQQPQVSLPSCFLGPRHFQPLGKRH